jgi:DeoR family transcriptional regulator, aga operon transcriptional repressor
MKRRSERLEELIRRIKMEKKTNIRDLAAYFSVSSVTIRRDLKEVQKNHNIVQTVNGGVEFRGRSIDEGIEDHIDCNVAEKIRIGEYISKIVADYDDLLIGPGTTTLLIGRILSGITDRRFRIVTNSMELAMDTMDLENIETLLLGGKIWKSYSLGYQEHKDYLDNCNNTHRLIISADGIDPEYGLTVFETRVVPLVKKMIRASREVIIAADYRKIGKVCFNKVADIENVNLLVTDDKAPVEAVEAIERKNVKVVIV